MQYLRFAAMIATSTVVMFVLMYLNTYAWEHVFYSETRVYMAFVMGATMAVIMLSFMLAMYTNKVLNAGIFAAAVAVFALSLWLVRSQATVDGVSYMRAMIPHHSIAIMTSERANITDPRVRKLADEIIAAQQREISQMRYLIADLTGEGGVERPETLEAPEAETASAQEAVETPVIRTMDPSPLEPADVAAVVEEGPACRFRRTMESPPILVASVGEDGAARGVLELNDTLVPLAAQSAGDISSLANGATMTADGMAVTFRPVAAGDVTAEAVEADLLFALEEGLTVGYRGFLSCEA